MHPNERIHSPPVGKNLPHDLIQKVTSVYLRNVEKQAECQHALCPWKLCAFFVIEIKSHEALWKALKFRMDTEYCWLKFSDRRTKIHPKLIGWVYFSSCNSQQQHSPGNQHSFRESWCRWETRPSVMGKAWEGPGLPCHRVSFREGIFGVKFSANKSHISIQSSPLLKPSGLEGLYPFVPFSRIQVTLKGRSLWACKIYQKRSFCLQHDTDEGLSMKEQSGNSLARKTSPSVW